MFSDLGYGYKVSILVNQSPNQIKNQSKEEYFNIYLIYNDEVEIAIKIRAFDTPLFARLKIKERVYIH